MRLTFLMIISLCSVMMLHAQINVSKTLNLSAGTLSSSLTADEKNTIAYLTLTGTIDARDFKTMRDSMPVLAELDLSGVSVSGYTGTKGTRDTTNFSYYANEIPINAFLEKSSLTNVKLPTNIVSIQQSAFQRCSGLTGTFEIPNSVIKFGGYTFYDCTGLSDFNIPKNLSSVGIFAFVRCKCSVNVDPENQNLSSDNGILFNKTKTSLIYYPTSKTGGYSIPSTVTNIEDAAFAYCKDLTSVEIPTSVTRIGQWSFDNCTGLTSIILPENLKGIGFSAFRNCSGLTSVNIPKTVTSIGGNAFITPNLTSIYTYGETPVNISNSPGVFDSVNKTNCKLFVPYGSKSAYQSANQWQDFLNIVEMDAPLTMPLNVTAGGLAALLPQSVRDTLTYLALTGTIDARDFKTMRDSLPVISRIDLSNVEIISYTGTEGTEEAPNVYEAKEIPKYSFLNPANGTSKTTLTEIVFQPDLFSISYGAFLGCTGLSAIEIPSSVNQIKNAAFENCTNLKIIKCLAIIPPELDGVVFSGVNKTTCVLQVPQNSKTDYQAAGEWQDFLNIEEISSIVKVTAGNLKTILAGQLDTTTKLTLSGTIDARDFRIMRDSMPMLAYLDLSDISILEYTGTEGTVIGNVNYPANSVPESALSGKVSLTSIILGNNITSISYEAFLSCSSLESVVLPSSLISIAGRAFGWSGLNGITFPDALQSIGNYAFSTNNIKIVDIPASVQTIGLAVFYQNRSLLEISVNPDNPNYCSINGVLFNKNHTELLFYPNGKADSSYVLPDGVQKIIAHSFNGGNSNLKNITIPEGVVEIESWAFANLGSLESIEIPSTIAVIAGEAFIGQHVNLQSIKIHKSTPVAISQDAFGEVNKTTCILYVPYGSKAAYQAAAQWQDFSNIVEMSGFILSSATANIEAAAASTSTVKISSDISWTAISDKSWLTVNPLTGSGNELTVTLTANSANPLRISRIGTVTISADGVNSQTITVTQEKMAAPDALIKKTNTNPVIDGIVDDIWATANTYNIDQDFINEYPTLGSEGQTTWKALWNNDGIFLMISVTDDEWYPSYMTNGNRWEYDGTEIYFDVNYVLKDGLGVVNNNGHIGISPTPLQERINGTPTTEADGVVWSYKVENANYIEELFIPFSKLVDKEGYTVDKTNAIGFDITVIDRDSGDLSRKRAVWANAGAIAESWSNMDDCGIIVLDGADPTVYIEEVKLTGGTITRDNGTLQIAAQILPENATNKLLNWSVTTPEGSNGRASINSSGVLTGMLDGVVTVTAKTTDGTLISSSVNVTISGQLPNIDEVNIIRNGNFDSVEADGMPTFWGGWVDGTYGASSLPCNVTDNIAVLASTVANPTENWHYQFWQLDLTALPNIPYVVSFKAWADNNRQIGFDFEDSSVNNYNRYGSSSDPESLGGRSEWSFPVTTTPTQYTFHVTFDQILPNTIQSFKIFLSQAAGTVYIDDVSVISENDILLIDTLPIVSSLTVSSITSVSATIESKAVANEKYPILEKGVCWSTSSNPSVTDSKTISGNGNGNYTTDITGLNSNTTYFARAYATNVKGTSYGNVLQFTTTDCSGVFSLVGTFNNWGSNNSDVILESAGDNGCTWNVIQKFNDFSEVKFRKNYSWDINWGNWNFPAGTGVQNGPNIPVNAGTYLISFKSATGEYNFESLNVKCNEQDSLALVAIYNATNGTNWGRKDNWLSGKVQDWYGVTVNQDGRVIGLNLANNILNGYIPDALGDMTELQRLHLGNNMFVTQYNGWNNLNQQPLPYTIVNLTKLQVLSLDGLSMNNELPDVFGGMSDLRELYINSNYFNNYSLPADILLCTNLEKLDITYNNFYQLPDFKVLKKLQNLWAYGCYFSFEDIEPNLWIPQFDYSGQRLIPGVSESINPAVGETILRTIEVGGTNNIYQWFKDGQELQGQTTNTLTIENIGTGDEGIYTLRVTNSIATKLIITSQPIIIYQNQLKVYNALVALYNSTGGNNWNRKNNWLSNEPITNWDGIDLDYGNGIYYLSLSNNNLVGNLPQEMGDLSMFYFIGLTGNPGLTGAIPNTIGQLSNLQHLYLNNNNLTGNIPSSIGQLNNLQYFDLSQNNLTGNIPASIGQMTNLKTFNVNKNQIVNLPIEIIDCNYLEIINLENNKISELPDLAELENLKWVFVKNNNLEFDDILPNIGQFNNFYYAPQDSIGESSVFYKETGWSFSDTLVTPGNQNQYQWYKDGVLLEGKTSATIEISSLTVNDKGKYYCMVTNPQAPNLTLVSRKITVNVESVNNLKMLSLNTLVPLSTIVNARAFCGLSNSEQITVSFTNTCKKIISNFKIGYKIDGLTIAEEPYEGSINPGDTLTYTFTQKADLTSDQYLKSFSIVCYLVYTDENPADNAITRTRNSFGNYTDFPGWTTYNSCDGMLSDISWAIAEDKNGNIWSTDFFGASKFDGTNWTTFTSANGLGQDYNWAMINDKNGNIWMSGSNNSTITKYDGNQFVKYPQNGVFEECIYADTKGNIWFGSWSGYGILKYDGSNWIQYPAADYGLGDYVVSIGEDKNGKIYFASSNGVKTFDGTNWGTLIMPEQNLYISEIFFDSKGFTWFTSGESFYKYDGTNWDVFTSTDGTINNCEDISEDIYGNIWFAGGNEIVKYDGNTWTKYSDANGLACGIKSIFSIHCDKNGNVWTGSFGGGISKLEQSNDCPQHFHTVWEGTSGTDHMNINIIEAKYDEIDLEVGDEIGVFDGNLCVGIGKLTKTVNQQNILSIKASRNDGTGNGFTSGNDITYKFWDCSAGQEYEVSDIQCFNNQLISENCQPFEVSATSYVKLSGISVICQKIGFKTGWNIFSVPSSPVPAETGVLFKPAIDNKSLVKIQDEVGNSLENWGIFGGWQDNIGDMFPTEGYKIKVSKADSIEICGKPVKYPLAIPLNAGWNIMGYPQLSSVGGMNVIQQLIDRGKLLKVQDENGNSIENWGIFGGWQNNIGDFIAGEGYKIKVNAKDTLWIYQSYPKSTELLPELVATIHFRPDFEGNGVDHMNINVVGLPVNMLRAGDELAVFDGETCVGAVTILPQHLKNQSVPIVASATDNQGMAGFMEGSQITLKLWKSDKNLEFVLEPEILKGTGAYAKHETTVASLEKYATTGLDRIADFGSSEINCYPNPFSDKITIEIKLENDSQLQVEVLNQLGQKVKTMTTRQLYPGGLHKLEWNGKNANNQAVAPGVYILHLKVNDVVFYKKILYSK